MRTYTQKQIADAAGVTREAVGQIERRALKKLRHAINLQAAADGQTVDEWLDDVGASEVEVCVDDDGAPVSARVSFECDTPAEVFALADFALERREPMPPALNATVEPSANPGRRTPKLKGPRKKRQPRLAHRPDAGDRKRHVKLAVTFLKAAGCAKRKSEIAVACSIPEADALAMLKESPEFAPAGKRWTLAARGQAPARPSATGPPGPPGVDEFEDPPPPRRPGAGKPAPPERPTPTLADRIGKFLRAEGPVGIPVISLAVEASNVEVKNTLREHGDRFRVTKSGWEVIA